MWLKQFAEGILAGKYTWGAVLTQGGGRFGVVRFYSAPLSNAREAGLRQAAQSLLLTVIGQAETQPILKGANQVSSHWEQPKDHGKR